MVMGSRLMAKAVNPHGLSGKPAVAGKTRVWTSAAVWEDKQIIRNENTLHTAKKT